MIPRAVSCFGKTICISYKDQILITTDDNSDTASGKIHEDQSYSPIKDICLLTNNSYSLTRDDESIEIWKWHKEELSLIAALSQ